MNNFKQMSKDLNRSSDNYKNLTNIVKAEYEKRISNGSKRPNWTSSGKKKGIIATLRNQNSELMENVFPIDKNWTDEYIKTEMKNMMNPNFNSLVKKEDGRKTRHAEEANVRKNLHANITRQSNEIARLKHQNNEYEQRVVNNRQKYDELLEKYNEVIKERNELLEYQPDNNQEILDIIEKTSNCILRRNNFMIATGVLWTSYTSSYQIMNCLRYILEKTLENLP